MFSLITGQTVFDLNILNEDEREDPEVVLYQLFDFLGTPDETTWPSVKTLPRWKANYARSIREPRTERYTIINNQGKKESLDRDETDFLDQFLVMNPKRRTNLLDVSSDLF